MLRILLIVFSLACAGAMSQFPEFFQQYTQRLGGTLDELNRQVEALDVRAQENGLGRFDYVRRFQSNEDPIIQGEGDAMIDMLARQVRLQMILDRLRAAPWYMHAIETVFHLEPDIAEQTLKDFVPAIPLSVSGGAHAFFGFFFGYLLPLCIRSLFPRKVIQAA